LQARRVAQVFSGRDFLPSTANMSIWLQKYWKRHAQLYPFDARLRQLVNQFEYTDLLANELKIEPRLWKLFFSQPRKWHTIYFESPWTPFLFRMNAIETEEEKLAYSRHVKCIPRQDQVFSRFALQMQGIFAIIFILFIIFFGALFTFLLYIF
jgi:hypothetical protein